jgi:tetratricopeptide (TPR) repeat protein
LIFPIHVSAHTDLHEQMEALSVRIAKHPKKAELYLKRGNIYVLHQDRDAAMADFERAEMLDPKLSAVHLARGRLFQQAGWPHTAKAALDRFLILEPGHPVGLSARAHVQVELENYLEAADDYARAIRFAMKPPPEFYLERARAFAAAGDEYVDRALEGLDEGIKRLGFVGTLALYSIELEVKRKHYDAALKRLDEITARSSRKERWFVRKGEILQQAGRTREAREAFVQANEAIEALPPRHRKTKAIVDLEARVRKALDNPPSDQ